MHVVYGLAFTTLFFRNYYVALPGRAGEGGACSTAPVSSASSGAILLPMSTPIIVVYADLAVHQDLERLPVRRGVLRRRIRKPITVALNNLVNTSTGVKEYNVDMAAAMIAALPTLLVYVVAGKYFVRGLTAGAVKG